MKCLFYHGSFVHVFNPNTKERKWLRAYYRKYGITTLKKHVYHDDLVIIKKNWSKTFSERNFWKKTSKKRLNVLGSAISNFFNQRSFLKGEKLIAIVICGIFLVQVFNFMFVSSSCFPF
jgi:hypothetical protein